ncbi:MAG TPA: hypothetical protein PKC18_05260 [Lacipirellulaceae bacterium]|nr:hypothetical protein [Lacipirellulaceae bacterium]
MINIAVQIFAGDGNLVGERKGDIQPGPIGYGEVRPQKIRRQSQQRAAICDRISRHLADVG